MVFHDVLGEWDHGLRIEQRDRAIAAVFTQPHTVLASALFGSGMRKDVDGIVNMQSCDVMRKDYQATLAFMRDDAAQLAEHFGLDFGCVSTMCTSASMNNHGIAQGWYEDSKCPKVGVIAVVTAGVEGNAGRAGDPTEWVEVNGDFHPREYSPKTATTKHKSSTLPHDGSGTINIMLFFSAPLMPTAYGRAFISATEAKSAVLADYAVGSLYSPAIATGTGTDQMVVGAPVHGAHFLSGVGHHTVMGELIGDVVMTAVRQSLCNQNGMTPESRCDVLAQLARFGLTQEGLLQEATPLLTEPAITSFRDNLFTILHDPVVLGLAFSVATVADHVQNGIIPQPSTQELVTRLGTQIASAVCSGQADTAALAAVLSSMPIDPAVLIPRAIALGWAHRYNSSNYQR